DFVLEALGTAGVSVSPRLDGSFEADPAQADIRAEFRDFLRSARRFRFSPQADKGVVPLARNHPLVEQLASTVLGQALEAPEEAAAKRVGVIRTSGVSTQTTMLLLRHRFHLTGRKGNRTWQTLAEELDLLAFAGRAEEPTWLTAEETRALLSLAPEGNLAPEQKTERLTRTLSDLHGMDDLLMNRAQERAAALLEAHERVRGAARGQGVTYTVEPPGSPDRLGVYLFLPMPKIGGIQ
ncbi:MAG: ATP-dependent helicase, partial [Deinococcus sp.]|nr:ATP-dependent helicase [Deinococcus sp.]